MKNIEKILTPKRMELIRSIKGKKPKSIGDLSKRLKRPPESVSRDLRILHSYGFLEFIQIGKQKIPRITKDLLMVPLTA